MNSTLKTSLVVIFVLSITFTLLFFYVDTFSSYLKKSRIQLEDKFYSHIDRDKKKIFLIGSSHVGRLNETYIQEYLYKNNEDYEVYNLAKGAETPWDRLPYIDAMIAANPDLVVYGVGYRDFLDTTSQFELAKPSSILPDPSQDFKYGMMALEHFVKYDFDKFRSPQLVFRYLVRDHVDIGKKQVVVPIYTKTKPFYPYDKSETIILNDTQLQKLEEGATFQSNTMPPFDKNENAYALSQSIGKFRQHNIKVVIFSTPHTKFYTNKVPTNIRNQFDLIIQQFTQKGAHVYLLRDKYVDLSIWSDNHHVAVNPNSLIYSQDIAKIILNETRP